MRRPISLYLLCVAFLTNSSARCDQSAIKEEPPFSNKVSDALADVRQARVAFPKTRHLIDWLWKSSSGVRSPSKDTTRKVNLTHAIPLPLSRPKAEIVAQDTGDSSPPAIDSFVGEKSALKVSSPRTARVDLPVQRVRTVPGELQAPLSPRAIPPVPAASVSADQILSLGGQSISLQAALHGTLTSNPDLATLRLGNPTIPSAEAVEVARHFPTTLNPTLWCDLRPITLIPPDPFGGGGQQTGSYYKFGQFYFYLSLRQPVELGHQTTHRYHIAKAAFEQQQWTTIQAELLALIQTYRFFQTAAYRRERLKVARRLADFNDRLLKTLERRLEANQVPAADVILARVESRAMRSSSRLLSKTMSQP